MGGKIYDVGWVSIHTTCGMNAHLYHIVGLSMLDAEDRLSTVWCSERGIRDTIHS